MKVGIYAEEGSYFYEIGRQIQEIFQKKAIPCSFVSFQETYSHLILLKKDASKIPVSGEDRIYISDKDEDDSIFLYQKKDLLMRNILKYIIPYGSEDIDTIGFVAYENSVASFSTAYLVSYLLGRDGHKVCFLSLNPFFPFEKTFPLTGSGGMSKLLYGIDKKQNIEILNYHHQYKFYYLDLPLMVEEMMQFSEDVLKSLKEFLSQKEITKLIVDFGVMDKYALKKWRSSLDRGYFITSSDDDIYRGIEKNYYHYLEGELEIIEEEKELLIAGKNTIILNPQKKGSKLWKKRLGIKY